MKEQLEKKIHEYEQHYAILFRYLENLDRMEQFYQKEIRPYSNQRVRLNFQMIDLLHTSLTKYSFTEKETTMVNEEIGMIFQSLVPEHQFSEEQIERFDQYKTPNYNEALETIEQKGYEGYVQRRREMNLPEITFDEYPLMQGLSNTERREHQRAIDSIIASKRNTNDWPNELNDFYKKSFPEQQKAISEHTHRQIVKMFTIIERNNTSTNELKKIQDQVESKVATKEYSQNTFLVHSVLIKMLQELKETSLAEDDIDTIISTVNHQNTLIREEVSSLISQEKYDGISFLLEMWKLNEDPALLLQQTSDREKSVVKKLKKVMDVLKTKKAIVHFLTMPLE